MRIFVLIFLFMVPASFAQSGCARGDYCGFTMASPEWILEEYGEPIVVSSVQGAIFAPSESPREGVLFEIRGPGKGMKTRGARTDKNGRFRMPKVPEGTYRFKATMDGGFNSMLGTLIVPKKANPKTTIHIVLSVSN